MEFEWDQVNSAKQLEEGKVEMMNQIPRFSILLLAVFLCALTAMAQPADRTKSFRSIEDKFSIEFPANPERKTEVAEAWFGKGTIITYMCSTDTIIYRLSLIDFPDPVVDEKDLNRRLDVIQGGERLQWGLKDIKEIRGKFNGYSGREMISESSVVTMASRSIFVGKRFVYLSVFLNGTSKSVDQKVWPSRLALIQDYFNSFEPTR